MVIDVLSLDDTFRIAPLTFPCCPTMVCSTLANVQHPIGWFSMCSYHNKVTNSYWSYCWCSTSMSVGFSQFNEVLMYPVFPELMLRYLTLVVRPTGFIWNSLSPISSWWLRPSGRLRIFLPMNRCDEVKSSSKSSGVMYDNGLELIITSTSVVTVSSSSFLNTF